MVHCTAADAAVLSVRCPESPRIYHFTDAKNLPGILGSGCVYCTSQLPPDSQRVDISHYDIQEQRRVKRVECEPWGVLHDYVPFYFATRSPMMYAISKGGVKGCSSDTTRLIYVVSSVQRVGDADLKFAFSDGHPTKAISRFYNDTSNMSLVDWGVMKSGYWNDTQEDPDRKRRRQAEFLVHGALSWSEVEFLAVKTPEMKRRLDRFLSKNWPDRLRQVRVEGGWYFP